jgi:hypothetical protein
VITKFCKECKESKSVDEFYVGYAKCKECARAISRVKDAKRRIKNKKKRNQYNREYGQKNKDRLAKIKQEEYEKNPTPYKERAKKWRKENVELHRQQAREEAKRRRFGRNDEANEYAEILLADPCSYCDGDAIVIDHIVASVEGGENLATNFTASCFSCNSRKRATSLLFFLLRAKPRM